jgi:hypothetical protein
MMDAQNAAFDREYGHLMQAMTAEDVEKANHPSLIQGARVFGYSDSPEPPTPTHWQRFLGWVRDHLTP